MTAERDPRAEWIRWLESYGAGNFYDAFVRNAQGAASRCLNCGAQVFLDIVEGGGIPDWRTEDGDYGCEYSPDTVREGPDAGTGSHFPGKL